MDEIIKCIEILLISYPFHIEKEDEHFFFPAMEYLSSQEQAAMLEVRLVKVAETCS